MKIVNYTLISLLTASLISCKKDGKTNESGEDSLTAKKDSVVIPEVHKEYYGIYTGEFAGMEKVVDQADGSEYD
ncbi:MAG: serine/threonine protein kinase, partial [Chryseobacterium sp.]